MRIALSEAKGRLPELVRRAMEGGEVILTKHGQPAVRLIAVHRELASEELRARRRAAIDRAIAAAHKRDPDGGPSAARSQDFLYGEDGLPA